MPRTRADTSTAFGTLDGVLEERLRFVVVPQALAQQFEIAEDHREQVVEIMRDSAGELADGLDLLRLAKCGLGAPARGHVEKAADNADELTARVPFDLLGDSGVQHLAGFRNEPVFRVPQLAKRKQPRPIRPSFVCRQTL